MAHTKKEKEAILKKAIKVAKEKKLHFIEEVCVYLPISTVTYWQWGFNKLNELKEILDDNKIEKKAFLRNKWAESSNATLNIALYKLLATPEERKILADRQIHSFEDNEDELKFEGWD